MKKIFCFFLCLTFITASSSLIAAEEMQATEITQSSTEPKETKPPPREIGKASNEGLKAAKKRDWQNWLFAGTSVAIAITALLLLRDAGHAPHHQ